MLRQSLTLLFALGAFGLLSGCGGAAMSGDSGTNKGKKKDDAVAIDAAEPYVVTGAYLACDYSPSDDAKGSKAIGCSILDDAGKRVAPSAAHELSFEAKTAGMSGTKPDLENTTNWSAVWQNIQKPAGTIFSGKILDRQSKAVVESFECEFPCKPTKAASKFTLAFNAYDSGKYLETGRWKPDDMCDQNGNPISSKQLADKACASFNSFQSFGQCFTRSFQKSAVVKEIPLRSKVAQTGGFCIYKRSGELVSRGTACSVIVFKPQGGAHRMAIYKHPLTGQAKQEIESFSDDNTCGN
jgi:hypothetical protein